MEILGHKKSVNTVGPVTGFLFVIFPYPKVVIQCRNYLQERAMLPSHRRRGEEVRFRAVVAGFRRSEYWEGSLHRGRLILSECVRFEAPFAAGSESVEGSIVIRISVME